MLCLLSPEAREARRITSKINAELKKDKRRAKGELKLLLLGAGESGKSTFLKQMHILHGEGFDKNARMRYIKLVYQGILTSVQNLTRAMSILKIAYANQENELHAETLHDIQVGSVKIHTEFIPYVEAIQSLWNDEGIQCCYDRRREYQLSDSTYYFLQELERIQKKDFLPTNQDILRTRVPTTGIIDSCFDISSVTLRIVDVGGQRSERRKWIHCFEDVTSIMFIAALSEYDQVLVEDLNSNRMEESIALYFTIISYNCFANASMILFLNKWDIFKEKVMNSHLSDYFSDYSGPRQDPEAACTFIYSKFMERKPISGKEVYHHITCATDTKNIQVTFEAVRSTVLLANLEDYNLQ